MFTRFISIALAALLAGGPVVAAPTSRRAKGSKGSSGSGHSCGPSAVEGTYKYVSQADGVGYQVVVYCDDNGKCQLTETSPDDCTYIAFFDAHDFEIKDGKCQLGYNRDGASPDLPEWTGENESGEAGEKFPNPVTYGDGYIPSSGINCTDFFPASTNGDFGFKAIVEADGNWRLLFTQDRGHIFYNEDPPQERRLVKAC